MAAFGRASLETLRCCSSDETVCNVVDQRRELMIGGDSMISSLRQLCIDQAYFKEDNEDDDRQVNTSIHDD